MLIQESKPHSNTFTHIVALEFSHLIFINYSIFQLLTNFNICYRALNSVEILPERDLYLND